MAGSTYGQMYRVTTWGESHGEALGVVIDGCPAGLELSEADIQPYLDRRKPGATKYATPRKEDDEVNILSGVFEGQATGTPISMAVYNKTQRSKDYTNIKNIYRPGHADMTFDKKYGIRDYRGGGRSSGRETLSRVCAGAVAAKFLKELGIRATAYTKSIGGITADTDTSHIDRYSDKILQSPLYMPDLEASGKAEQALEDAMRSGDSLGGIIECVVQGMIPGLGEPVFDKLDAELSKAVMSIGAVKGIEIGEGFAVAGMRGSENNDSLYMAGSDAVKKTNHSGGTLGGISDGSDIVLKAAIKPTPSISRTQATVTKQGIDTSVEIGGRHDPVIVPRAVVVVESMVNIVLMDMMLKTMSSNMKNIKKVFEV